MQPGGAFLFKNKYLREKIKSTKFHQFFQQMVRKINPSESSLKSLELISDAFIGVLFYVAWKRDQRIDDLKKKFHREIKHETSILISPEEKIKKEAIQISILENALKKEHNESAELSKENEILQVLIKEQQNELEILRLNCQNLKRNKALQLGKSQESLSEKNDKSIIAELTLKIAFKDKEIEQLMKFNHEQRKQIENLELKVGSASTEAKRNFVSIFGN